VTRSIDLLRNAKRIGFLFTGGSSRCIFQVGAVETLSALGIRPAACLGVSAGVWNAAAVAVGNAHRLRAYWRFFSRMPAVDLRNLFREHSPFAWSRLHARAFDRYVGAERIPHALPLYVALTRLRDRQPVVVRLNESAEPSARCSRATTCRRFTRTRWSSTASATATAAGRTTCRTRRCSRTAATRWC
jgi:predicted acylesterase/phospholipase RssA